jgi:ribose transport system ATP-binding protein
MSHKSKLSHNDKKHKSIRLEKINKSFPGVQALKDVSMDFTAGEVISIVGQNGAGKSTLMDILGGVKQKDSGEIFFDDQQVQFNSPKDSMRQGVSYIHQELTLFNNLTVAENVMFNELKANRSLFFLNSRQINEKCSGILKMIEPSIKSTDRVEELAVGQKQIVEISRAIATGASIIIFDEPTSSLTLKEKESLYDLINLLKSQGYIIIYITHHFEEIFRIADRIYVLRDGANAGEVKVKDTNTNELAKLMLGEYVTKMYVGVEQGRNEDLSSGGNEDILRVHELTSTNGIDNISFSLREKEVLGVWGLLGSGRTELVRGILKLDPIVKGNVEIKTDRGFVELPKNFTKNFGYVPENRREEGLFLNSPVLSNMSIGRIKNFSNKLGFIKKEQVKKKATKASEELGIKMVNILQTVDTLSGGNQQKVVIARWLMFKPDIFVLDDPTKGLDIGAKADVYKLINNLVEEGISVILISSDIDELIHMSNRIMVLVNNQLVKTLNYDQANKELLMEYSMGNK